VASEKYILLSLRNPILHLHHTILAHCSQKLSILTTHSNEPPLWFMSFFLFSSSLRFQSFVSFYYFSSQTHTCIDLSKMASFILFSSRSDKIFYVLVWISKFCLWIFVKWKDWNQFLFIDLLKYFFFFWAFPF